MERYDMEGISLGQLFWMYYLSMQDLNNNKKNLIKVEESVSYYSVVRSWIFYVEMEILCRWIYQLFLI